MGHLLAQADSSKGEKKATQAKEPVIRVVKTTKTTMNSASKPKVTYIHHVNKEESLAERKLK